LFIKIKRIVFVQMDWDGALVDHKIKWNMDEPKNKKEGDD
jgi:hypothetical protein